MGEIIHLGRTDGNNLNGVPSSVLLSRVVPFESGPAEAGFNPGHPSLQREDVLGQIGARTTTPTTERGLGPDMTSYGDSLFLPPAVSAAAPATPGGSTRGMLSTETTYGLAVNRIEGTVFDGGPVGK